MFIEDFAMPELPHEPDDGPVLDAVLNLALFMYGLTTCENAQTVLKIVGLTGGMMRLEIEAPASLGIKIAGLCLGA